MPRHGSPNPASNQPPPSSNLPRQWGLTSWPINRKLGALIALPLAFIITGVLFLLAQSYSTYKEAQRDGQLVAAIRAANEVIVDGNNELRLNVDLVKARTAKQQSAVTDLERKLREQHDKTNRNYDDLLQTLREEPTSGGWPKPVNDLINGGNLDLNPQKPNVVKNGLNGVHNLNITSNNSNAVNLIARRYVAAFKDLRQLSNELSNAIGGTAIGSPARFLSNVSNAANTSGQQTLYMTIALSDGFIAQSDYDRLMNDIRGAERTYLDQAIATANPTQQTELERIRKSQVFGDDVIDGITKGPNNRTIGYSLLPKVLEPRSKIAATAQQNPDLNRSNKSIIANTFLDVSLQRSDALDNFFRTTAQQIANQNQAETDNALLRMAIIATIALLSILGTALFVTAVARSITHPMRRLRSGAVDAATVRLPAAVRQIEREGPTASVVVPPVLPTEEKVGPETREVAHALDGLAHEAVRLATGQVRMRQSLDEAFVSMSRRSQSMVEKQLSIIDDLENSEEDPEQLRNLFRLDHLAARMRRYNDNLLVLAGSTVRSRSAAPVPIADVFRAATSEMEQYERVRLQPLSGASVNGSTAGGLIHLLAELLDNAAMYSPPTSPIVLSAAYNSDGGLHLEVVDSGVGIPPAELADLNARLGQPGTIDTHVSSRMGLFVVGRLAQRGGFTVRLSPRAGSSGTVAEIDVPASHVLGSPTGAIPPVPSSATPPVSAPRLPSQHQPVSTSSDAPMQPGVTAGTDGFEPPSGTTAGGLPARRPGASLANTPLGAGMPPEISTGPTPHPGAFSAKVPWDTSESASEAQRNGAAAGIGAARRRMGEQTGTPAAAPAATPAAAAAPLPKRQPGTHAPAQQLPFAAPGDTQPSDSNPFEPANQPAEPGAQPNTGSFELGSSRIVTTPVPGNRPGSRPLPVRSPNQSGATLGASAARAVAAAAAARSSTGRPATNALFAPTGPTALAGATPSGATPAPAAPPLVAPAPPGAPQASLGGPNDSPLDETSTARTRLTPAPHALGRRPGPGAGMPASAPQAAPPAAASQLRPPISIAPPIPVGQTPIFDSISAWFATDHKATKPTDDTTGDAAGETGSGDKGAGDQDSATASVIDLRDNPVAGGETTRRTTSGSDAGAGNRWASLGDQRWVAINARAAASPQTAGNTATGLPRRRPGANLLPSAASTIAQSAPIQPVDAESVRGRLGSYQRGLTSARRARHLPDGDSGGLFTTPPAGGEPTVTPLGDKKAGNNPSQQGGES